MTNRFFGIEIECYFPGGLTKAREELSRVGLYQWSDLTGTDISIGGGSRIGVEVKSSPIQGHSGLKEVKLAMNVILANGGYVDNTCGLHVHHNAPEYMGNTENCIRLAETWYLNQSEIKKFVLPHRWNYRYCPDVEDWQLQEFIRTKNISHMPRGGLNFGNLRTKGTVELRLHHGSLDFEEVSAWIAFGQKLVESCVSRKSSINAEGNPEVLLRRIRLAKTPTEILKKKVANA